MRTDIFEFLKSTGLLPCSSGCSPRKHLTAKPQYFYIHFIFMHYHIGIQYPLEV